MTGGKLGCKGQVVHPASAEVATWIMSFGPRARVTGPPTLRNRMRDILARMHERHAAQAAGGAT